MYNLSMQVGFCTFFVLGIMGSCLAHGWKCTFSLYIKPTVHMHAEAMIRTKKIHG
jgi:hypothetical protein